MWCHLSTNIGLRRSLRFVALGLLSVALITTLFLANVSHAVQNTTKTVSFQGRLQTAAGAVVADGHYNMQFKIYQDGAGTAVGNPGGSLKWTETYINNNTNQGVEVKNGFFSVNLGSVNQFGTSVDWNQDTLFLSMNVAGSAAACTTFNTAPCVADDEMLPMKQITATPYAINAGAVGGKTVDQLLQNTATLQTNTNLALQSASDSNVTAYLEGRTNQTSASLLVKQGSAQTGKAIDVQNSSGTSLFNLGSTGNATFRTSTDSSTALQLQNATGGSIFSIGTQGEPNNQIANGSIETNTTGWSAKGASTISRTTSQHYSGGAALQVVTTTANNDGVKYPVTLTAGDPYTVSVNVKLSSGTFTNMSLGYSSDGGITETDCKANQKVFTNGWSVINCTFTPTAISNTPYFYVKQGGSGTARTFYLDAVHLVPGLNIGAYYEATLTTTAAFTSNISIQSATDGQSTFQVQSSNGSDILTADSANLRVGIGLAAPKGALHVVSSNTADPTAIFQIGAGQTADTFQIRDINQTVFTKFDKDANLTIKPTTTSTSTFPLQVQNSGGSNMLSVNTSATNGAPNVQVGARTGSGTPTLLTLDKTSSAPSISGSSALVGSMYYDTTLGKVQCYEADGWGACGAAPDTFITISPEYTNAVMNGADIGTITSDLCSDTLNINDGSSAQPTICGTNETYNFYKWTSAEATNQTRSIFVTYQLPSNFKGFVAGSTSLLGRTNSSNSAVTYQIYRDHGGLTSCGTISVSSGSQTTWQKAVASGASDPSTCGFVAGDSIFFRINVTAKSNAQAYISNLNFAFSNN